MFTGLIESVGSVRHLRRGDDNVRLAVATALPMNELTLGESIAVNGICLTVVGFGGGCFEADVSPETLARSNFGELAPGSPVNLERALRLSDRLGGHLVTGHVDAVGTVVARRKERNATLFTIGLPAEIARQFVPKGSVAVDGISLTVNTVGKESFSVTVIPHTLAETTLREKAVGSRVNIETDIIGKYVMRLLEGRKQGGEGGSIDLEFLAKHGFV